VLLDVEKRDVRREYVVIMCRGVYCEGYEIVVEIEGGEEEAQSFSAMRRVRDPISRVGESVDPNSKLRTFGWNVKVLCS
jgi:hypothetical protein